MGIKDHDIKLIANETEFKDTFLLATLKIENRF